MSVEENKAVVRKMLEAMDRQDPSVAGELFTEDWVNIDPSMPPMPRGPEGARILLSAFTGAMPDYWATIGNIIGEGDLVAANFTSGGTHTGEFLGIPPSGKTLRITATGFFRVRDGKIAENRVNFDALGMLQQMGVVPEAGQAPA